jgi:hypothetical protein
LEIKVKYPAIKLHESNNRRKIPWAGFYVCFLITMNIDRQVDLQGIKLAVAKTVTKNSNKTPIKS